MRTFWKNILKTWVSQIQDVGFGITLFFIYTDSDLLYLKSSWKQIPSNNSKKGYSVKKKKVSLQKMKVAELGQFNEAEDMNPFLLTIWLFISYSWVPNNRVYTIDVFWEISPIHGLIRNIHGTA